MIDYDAKKRNELSVIAKNVNLGNITPSFPNNNLSQFKNEINSFKEKNRINYSDRFTEIDRDYLSAVERGDMETAQRMVDEAQLKKAVAGNACDSFCNYSAILISTGNQINLLR